MAELTNNDNLIPVKVKVNQTGFPEALCSYIKGEGKRSDLFLVDEEKVKDLGVFIVTPDVVEALGRKEKSHLGVISSNGEVLIPLENQEILITHRNIFVAISKNPTTLEVKNAIKAKESDNASELSKIEAVRGEVLSQMKGDMIVSDPFLEARAYKLENNSNGVCCVEAKSLPASYISVDDNNVYSHTNMPSSMKIVPYNKILKTEDIVAVGIDKEEESPVHKTPDKIEMPAVDEKEEVSKEVTPTYDKLFTTLEKAKTPSSGAATISSESKSSSKIDVQPRVASTIGSVKPISIGDNPTEQLDKINTMLEAFVVNNPTDKLKQELRKARGEIDKLHGDLKESSDLIKSLNSKCTDYQNESYALSATNKDLKSRLVQYKESNGEMKEKIAELETKLAQMSAKLSHTVSLFSSLIGESQNIGNIQTNDTVKKVA